MTEKPFFASLKARALIKVAGKDRRSFLQGLMTNDVGLLERQRCVYACLLTPQGKFQFDFFMSEEDGVITLDCEGGDRAQALVKLLTLYILRADVTLDLQNGVCVYAVWGENSGMPDPRHKNMGFRCYKRPENMEEKPFAVWDEKRIRLCIPDGSRDMVVGQSGMLECGIDRLNGVSFDKGCYMGQELTARTHYRGLVKRHLYAVEADSLPDSGTEIKVDDRIIGEMRSSCGRIGLALLKDDERDNAPFKIIS